MRGTPCWICGFGRVEVTYIEWGNKSDVSEEAFCYVIDLDLNDVIDSHLFLKGVIDL